MAAAVRATQAGFKVTVFEASRTLGGRARKVAPHLLHPHTALDNGQHILLGAYTDCLNLMRLVGVDTEAAFLAAFLRTPLRLGLPALTEQGHPGRSFELPVRSAPWQAQASSKWHGHHHAARLAKVAWAIWRSTIWPVSERLQL